MTAQETQEVDPNKAALEAAKAIPTYTADQLAVQQGKASLENTPDIDNTRQAYLNELQKKGFAQWALDMKADADRRLEEDRQRIAQEQKNARLAGYTELGAAIANLVGVGAHNAVSQKYKSYSQDWMRKADQDAREHRNRIDDIRARQRETELKMAQISQQGIQAAIQNERQREQDRLANELRKAQIEYQNARTETERSEAAEKLKYIQAQTAAQDALARQRGASAYASVKNAETKAREAARKGQQQEELNNAKVEETKGKAAYQWSRATGQPAPQPAGWSVQQPAAQSGESQPATTPSKSDFEDERGLPKHKK